jgi:hypothetical protein
LVEISGCWPSFRGFYFRAYEVISDKLINVFREVKVKSLNYFGAKLSKK